MSDNTRYRVITCAGRLYVEKCLAMDGGEKFTDWCEARDRVIEILAQQKARAEREVAEAQAELDRVAKWTGP